MQDNHLVWLASYPKSGNTWFRIFLANALVDAAEPRNINELELATPIAASRSLFHRVAGWPSSLLTLPELRLLQPSVYRQLAQIEQQVCYLKTHEAYTKNSRNEWLHAPDASRGCVYFVRNPLDVCLSWANHCGISVDRSIKQMGQSQWLAGKRSLGGSQFAQQTLSWSQHVLSWTQQSQVPVLVLRYEDMLTDPEKTFASALRFLGLDLSYERLQKAIRFSSFGELKRQEDRQGFAEKPDKSKAFFRQGTAGHWRQQLSPPQIDRITNDHAAVMQQFGYCC